MAQNGAQLERLKEKYQPAIDTMQQLGVELQDINLEANRLFVTAIAPSEEVKNTVWEQIKRIDAEYSDLVCDLRVSPPQAAPAMAGASREIEDDLRSEIEALPGS